MKATFYDLKNRKRVELTVTEKVTMTVRGAARYAFKGVTEDGRTLTLFTNKEKFDSCKAACTNK